MQDQDTTTFTMGDIIFDAVTMNEAAVSGDFEQSRVRARHIGALAAAEGLHGIAEAAHVLSRLLGPSGTDPQPGFGNAMVEVSRQIDLAFGEG